MFKDEVAKSIFSKTGLPQEEILQVIEIPPDSKLGDYAFPCFSLGKHLKRSPVECAKELEKEDFKGNIEKVKAVGPYLNFFIKLESWGKTVNQDHKIKKDKKRKIMVEYSQPNTHKAFHVGHLRGTSIGEALSRILKFVGHEVIQTNYSGDTGSHIAKWLWYYTKNKSNPPKDSHELEKWIADIYTKAVKKITEKNEEEVNEILRKLETGEDKELTKIYKKTREWSIDALKTIYKDLDAHFDYWYFESEVEKRGKDISKELFKKGIAEESDGAVIIDLEDVNLGVWVLLRKDGTALYSAKDLALAESKFKKFKVEESIYVVGAAQTLHLRQLFTVLQRMKYKHADKCSHLSFAEVRLPSGKMSSRTGDNILYSDIRKEVIEYIVQEIEKRREWNKKQIAKVAEKVAVAALKFDMLAVTPNKTITFDPKKATEFDGETGPYLQYTHARACSILRKAGKYKKGDGKTLTTNREQLLLKTLAKFSNVIERSARDHAPSYLARYCMELAQIFNTFYHECNVIGADNENDRLALVEKTTKTISKSLELLGIEAPEEM